MAPFYSIPTEPSPSPPSDPSPISWQSAYWGFMAVYLPVIMQNAGAVADQHYHTRIGLRASPVFCAIDTLMAIVKFIAMMWVGCNYTTAAQHVWWARFPDESHRSASGTGRDWALGMWAFVLSAFPQLVKLYSIRGMSVTHGVMSIYLVSFTVMEVFRLLAGPSIGYERLMPMPIVEVAKKHVRSCSVMLLLAGEFAQTTVLFAVLSQTIPRKHLSSSQYDNSKLAYFLAYLLAFLIAGLLAQYWVKALLIILSYIDSYLITPRRDHAPWNDHQFGWLDYSNVEVGQQTNQTSLSDGRSTLSNLEPPGRASPREQSSQNDANDYGFDPQDSTTLPPQRALISTVNSRSLDNDEQRTSKYLVLKVALFNVGLPVLLTVWLGFVLGFVVDKNMDRGSVLNNIAVMIPMPMFTSLCVLLYFFLLSLHRFPRLESMISLLGIRGKDKRLELFGFCCLILNMLSVCVYYFSVFEPKNTRKPAWAESLG